MGTLFARPDYFERFAKIGIERKIPMLVVSSQAAHLSDRDRKAATSLEPWVKKVWNAGLPVLDGRSKGNLKQETAIATNRKGNQPTKRR